MTGSSQWEIFKKSFLLHFRIVYTVLNILSNFYFIISGTTAFLRQRNEAWHLVRPSPRSTVISFVLFLPARVPSCGDSAGRKLSKKGLIRYVLFKPLPFCQIWKTIKSLHSTMTAFLQINIILSKFLFQIGIKAAILDTMQNFFLTGLFNNL